MRPVLPTPLDVEALLAFHSAQFGNARMEGDDDNKPDDKPDEGTKPDDDKPDPEADLSDAGKRALQAERQRAAKAEKAAAKAAKERDAHAAELEALRGESKSEAEKAVEAARKEATKEATARANRRIVSAEVKAAAGTKLADPADAVLHLDLTEFEVDDDGNVDTEAIAKAIDDLLKDKPYLAATNGKRFQGGADQGARKDDKRATSLEDAVGGHYATSR